MLAAALLLLAALDPRAFHPEKLADCDALVAQHPREYEAWFCYTKLTFRPPSAEWRAKTVAHLKALVARAPAEPLPRLLLALNDYEDEEKNDVIYEEVAKLLHAQRLYVAELAARSSLALNACAVGRFTVADEQLALLGEAARLSGRSDLAAWTEATAAHCALKQADYGRALLLSAAAREQVLSAPESWLRPWLLGNLLDIEGEAYASTGRHAEALELFRAQLQTLSGNPQSRACALHRVAEEAVLLSRQGGMAPEEATLLAREALADDLQSSCLYWANGGEMYTRGLLAQLLGPTDGGIAEAKRALAAAQRESASFHVCGAARLVAALTADRQPQEALAAADTAVILARKFGSGLDLAKGLLVRAHVLRRAGDRQRGLADALLALDQFDLLRARQPDATVRARSASESSYAYRYVAGLLLEGAVDPQELNQSLAAMERLRARGLLDLLEAGHAPPEALPLRREREEILAQLSRVQRALVDPALPAQAREERLAELSRLEAREGALRDRIARAGDRPLPQHEPPPQLAQLQQALAPDEALLLFQIFAPDFGVDSFLEGSSWLLLVTRDGARALRVPDARALEGQVELFGGLVERRDGSERDGAQALQRELLEQALQTLPAGVDKLFIVPDGPLHRLPFEALRDAEGTPLAARYRVSLAPSAALWLRFRRAPGTAAEVPALALGDPELGGGRALALATSPAAERGAESFLAGLRLSPLPYARDEARNVVAALGRGSVLRLGAEASERYFKTADLRRFGVLHLATHAVVDESRPERSAIVLAPGAPEEDGLLQVRELAGLDLAGRVVVLASCSSSNGEVLQGEGAMSLARGFFESGARTVVGALWPLRDDESAQLFGAFYRHLGRGLSVADAMALARRDRIAAGAPAAAWAGLSVMGDGDATPVAAPSAPPASAGRAALAGLALMAALTLLAFALFRRTGVRGR